MQTPTPARSGTGLSKPATRTLSDLVNHQDEAWAATPATLGPWLEHVARLAVVAADDEPSVDGLSGRLAGASDEEPSNPSWKL